MSLPRYPSFIDALRDLDDSLSMLALFATMPTKQGIQARVVHNCRRLMGGFVVAVLCWVDLHVVSFSSMVCSMSCVFFPSVEFMHYVVTARCLRKVFISIKGIYYQVEVQGQTITWISPHQFCQKVCEGLGCV